MTVTTVRHVAEGEMLRGHAAGGGDTEHGPARAGFVDPPGTRRRAARGRGAESGYEAAYQLVHGELPSRSTQLPLRARARQPARGRADRGGAAGLSGLAQRQRLGRTVEWTPGGDRGAEGSASRPGGRPARRPGRGREPLEMRSPACAVSETAGRTSPPARPACCRRDGSRAARRRAPRARAASRSNTLPASSGASRAPGGNGTRPWRSRIAMAARRSGTCPEKYCDAPCASHAWRSSVRRIAAGRLGGGSSGLLMPTTSAV